MDSLLSYENLACSDRPPSSRRILIIDDDPALLEALGDMLRFRLSNVIVETCGDPAVAVQQARHGHYDLILCDLCMSGNNGFELLPLLRRAAPRAMVAS